MENTLEKFLKDDYSKWGVNNYLYEKKENGFEPVTYASFIENVNYLASYFVHNGYKDKIIGKAVLRLSPFSKFGRVR